MDDAAGPSQQQLTFLPFQTVPRPPTGDYPGGFNLGYKVSPGILLVVIVLVIIVFLGGLAHLIVRILMRTRARDPDDVESVTALQGQLQQLFNLHDAGVEQSFIDTLPVFHYKAILGQKAEDFDCAVCLCEFEPEDKLRLLPKCSHAFHMECIDTWLLSHSTCPLCRNYLIHDFYQDGGCPPYVLVLESRSESLREIVCNDRESVSSIGRTSSVRRSDIHFNLERESEMRSCEINGKEKEKEKDEGSGELENVVHVKLGKLRNLNSHESCVNDVENKVDSRRCFSMGSLEYVMDENSTLLLPIETLSKKNLSRKPLNPGDYGSMRLLGSFDSCQNVSSHRTAGNTSNMGKDQDSFSISKIWQRGREKAMSSLYSSRRAMSFRFIGSNSDIVLGREGKDAAGSDLDADRGNHRRFSTSSIHTPSPSIGIHTSFVCVPGMQTNA